MSGKIATAIARYREEINNSQAGIKEEYDRPAKSGFQTSQTHLSDYAEILLRRKWLIIVSFILIVGTVSAATFLMTPQYKATAQLIMGGQPTPIDPLGEQSQRLPERNLYYQTQVNLLSSRTLSGRVISDLELEEKMQAEAEKTTKDSDSIYQKIKNIVLGEKKESIEKNDSNHAWRSIVQDWYLGKLSVQPVRDSSLVNLSFTGPDPELITIIVNYHAMVAIENTIQEHQYQAKAALDWLKEQINEQKNAVENSQRAIYNFKKKNNVLSLEDSQIIFSQEIQELNSALTAAKSDRIAKQAVYLQLKDVIENKQNVMLLPEISNYSVIQALRNQMVDLKSRKIELSTKFGPKHPKMIELNNGINQLRSEIELESKRLQNTIKAELDRAMTVERSITQSLEKQKKIAMDLGERAIEYEVLKQQAESAQDVYDFLLKQSEQLGLSSAMSSSNMRIVDKAEVPIKPVSPKKTVNILLSMILSLFFGIGLAFFVDYLDNSVKTPMDVAVQLGLPVLGMVPFQKSLKENKANYKMIENGNNRKHKNNNSFTPLYHISNRLPAELRTPAEGLSGRVLMVESVTMGEGKSTVLAQVASNLTDAGLRVLLVDCDFQRPSLDKFFNIVRNGGGLGKSIDRIMSHQINRGSLKDYSIDDLFFLMALKKKSGALIVQNEDQSFTVHFQNGVLIHIQNENSPENQRIGNMLLKGGFITNDQLNDALNRHHRTGQPIGYILVNAGYISRDKLRGPLRLQIEEYIQKIFSWRNGEFSFKPGIISIYENEKIFFEEDFTPLINNLGRTENGKFIGREILGHIKPLQKENMYLLPAGSSYRLIGSLNQILMKKIFEKLKQNFDVILVDTPPLDAASGIESIFPLADGIILVIKAGHLSIKILNGAINHMPQDKIIGTVLNQAKDVTQPYYY